MKVPIFGAGRVFYTAVKTTSQLFFYSNPPAGARRNYRRTSEQWRPLKIIPLKIIPFLPKVKSTRGQAQAYLIEMVDALLQVNNVRTCGHRRRPRSQSHETHLKIRPVSPESG